MLWSSKLCVDEKVGVVCGDVASRREIATYEGVCCGEVCTKGAILCRLSVEYWV